MKGHNENPDGGYDHFHESGRRAPHQGRLVQSVGDRRAPNSGPGGMGQGPSGRKPEMKPMPVTAGKAIPGGSEGGV